MGCNEAQRQWFCLSMLPNCVPTSVNKQLDNWVGEAKISTWDLMWRAFCKAQVTHLPHHAQHWFKAVSLKTSGAHICAAGWPDFCRQYRHLSRYIEDWTEDLEAARMYDMVQYKWQEKVQAEGQKSGGWRTVVKILLPGQQQQGLLQCINSCAMAHWGLDTMKNALVLPTEDRRMHDTRKAMNKVKWTTGILYVQALDQQMTADEAIDFIREKMRRHNRKEAQHQDRGGQCNWQPRDVRQTDAYVAEPATPAKQDRPKGSGSMY